MCYEVHGEDGKYFNLISDTCTSVNALFSQLPSNPRLNRMSEIGVYARGTSNQCTRIQINLDSCAGYVNKQVISSTYSRSGISVRPYLNRWRVSVPNCVSSPSLVMWIACEQDPDMLRFRIARGNNLTPSSHGLLGNSQLLQHLTQMHDFYFKMFAYRIFHFSHSAQFWNIPITIAEEGERVYLVLFNFSSPHYRRIPALLEQVTWDHTQAPCYYVGDSQGGPELSNDPRESVIEGGLVQYQTSSLFGTSFFYSKFEESQCSAHTQ